MNKTLKYALFSIPVLVGGYLIYKQLRKPKSKATNTNVTLEDIKPPVTNPVTTNNTNETIYGKPCDFPLKKGVGSNSHPCDWVKNLQWALNRVPEGDATTQGCFTQCNLKPLVEDGVFGPNTEALLKDTMAWTTIDNIEELDKVFNAAGVDTSQPEEEWHTPMLPPTPAPAPCNPLYEICL
jgi:hypothetical protein